jgi:hypothetical protein
MHLGTMIYEIGRRTRHGRAGSDDGRLNQVPQSRMCSFDKPKREKRSRSMFCRGQGHEEPSYDPGNGRRPRPGAHVEEAMPAWLLPLDLHHRLRRLIMPQNDDKTEKLHFFDISSAALGEVSLRVAMLIRRLASAS